MKDESTKAQDMTVAELEALLKAKKKEERESRHGESRATRIAKAIIWHEQTIDWTKSAQKKLDESINREALALAKVDELKSSWPEITEEAITKAKADYESK